MTPEEIDQLADSTVRATTRLTRHPVIRDHDHTLQEIIAGALEAVNAASHAGLTVVADDGRITATAPSGQLAARLDQAQAVLREGPCVTAAGYGTDPRLDPAVGGRRDTPRRVVVHDLADVREARSWPRFAPEALRNHVRSVLSLPLRHRSPTMTLNLYAERPGAFGSASCVVASGFAGQAAVALRAAEHVVDLDAALSTRDLIGQAKGILMMRHRIDAEAAFGMLVDASQAANMKLRDVADWLVEDAVATGDRRALPGSRSWAARGYVRERPA